MFEADTIRDWRDHDVADRDGNKIGQLEAVYVDTASSSSSPACADADAVRPGETMTAITKPGTDSAAGAVR